MNKHILVLMLTLLLAGCGKDKPAAETGHGHSAEEAGHEEAEKGAHGGRLLEDGDFGVEVTLFERGVPPEFRIYGYQGGKQVAPAGIVVNVELSRLGGVVDRHIFRTKDDYLVSHAEVYEPHSFDVKVTAQRAGKAHSWNYESYEGRTAIPAEIAKKSGIQTAVAAPGTLRETLTLYGSIQPNAERMRDVAARFPGVIRSVSAKVGDAVRAGQTLATIESNESLQTYAVASPIAGVVTERHANPGESTDSEPLFKVADFSSVWAELSVFPRDHARLRTGQSVVVLAADGPGKDIGKVAYLSPAGSTGSQNIVARVVLDNSNRQWTPGVFVTGTVTVGETEAALVIPLEAVQSFRDWKVAFISVGDIYEARPLELGRDDGVNVEVLAGLKTGEQFVSANGYLVKADIEKSGAAHDH